MEYKSIPHCHGIFFISILVSYLFPLITHHIMIHWSDWAIYVCKCNAFKYKHIFVRIFRKMMAGLETESLINGYRFSWNVNFSIISHSTYFLPSTSFLGSFVILRSIRVSRYSEYYSFCALFSIHHVPLKKFFCQILLIGIIIRVSDYLSFLIEVILPEKNKRNR